jgi:hypothetical protein
MNTLIQVILAADTYNLQMNIRPLSQNKEYPAEPIPRFMDFNLTCINPFHNFV